MPLDNQQELFYWVDQHDQEIGSITREEAHADPTKIHRSIGVLLLNDQQEMLFQKRSQHKDKDPGLWTYAVGGHVEYGQTYSTTAEREMQEELGITAQLSHIGTFLVNKATETEYQAIFTGTIAADTQLKPDPTEVEQTRWVPLAELHSFIETYPVVSWTKYILEKGGYV